METKYVPHDSKRQGPNSPNGSACSQTLDISQDVVVVLVPVVVPITRYTDNPSSRRLNARVECLLNFVRY